MSAAPKTWIRPLKNGRIIAAFAPARRLAKTPKAALSKKSGIKPAMIIVGEWNRSKAPIARNWPNAPNKNPIVTALGSPNAKVAATSIPGTEPGNSRSEMPVKLSVSSPTKVRTPSCRIVRLTANPSDVVMI